MARREFTQVPYKYGDNKLGFALGQTRGGVEEFITPMAFWELDTASGLYMPPGESTNPKRPRVTVNGEVQISGSYPEHRLLSTDPKPDAATEGKGATIYEIDTKAVYMSNGAAWVVQ